MITCCLLIIFTSYGLVPLGRPPKRVTNFDFEGNIVEYLTPLDLLTANFINFLVQSGVQNLTNEKARFTFMANTWLMTRIIAFCLTIKIFLNLLLDESSCIFLR